MDMGYNLHFHSDNYGPPLRSAIPFSIMSPFTHILVPSVLSMKWLSVTFSLRPDEAMLDLPWQVFISANKIILLVQYKEICSFMLSLSPMLKTT